MDITPGTSSGASGILYRVPRLEDGVGIHSLVRDSKPLDLNSLYSYLLLTAHFQDTCVVAELRGEIVGYISAYVHPKSSDTLFVWQVAVSGLVRKQGVGISMLEHLLKRPSLSSVRMLETTVNPSNTGSARLFKALARRLGAPCRTSVFFSRELFEGQSHEEEVLFRIGPFSRY
jgi:L-2,4-diaminobutyric acid acetyltransferase